MAGNVKKSMKPIPPTLRGKKRYVLFELISESKFDEKEVSRELWKVMHQLFGECGVARQRFWFIKWSRAKSRGIVRCALDHLDDVKTGILFMKEVADKKVIPKTLLTSGSIAKLKKKL